MYSENFGFGPGGFLLGGPFEIGGRDIYVHNMHIYMCSMYTYIYMYMHVGWYRSRYLTVPRWVGHLGINGVPCP